MRPSLTKYVIVRLVIVSIFITIIYAFAIIVVLKDYKTYLFHIGLFIFLLLVIIVVIYRATIKVKQELNLVKKYLSGVDNLSTSNPQAEFFAYEFEEINTQLIQILRKINKRDKQKRKYIAKIKLKNRQRSVMLSAIAHEFRNPISSIIGYAQTINEDDTIPPNLRKKFLTKIYKNGEKIEELLSRLLLWNRFESGEYKLEMSRFDITPLLEDIKLNLQEKYKNRKIDIPKKSLVVEADRTLIEIVIKNLIENALKYSKSSVKVKIEDNKISIIDRGIGISTQNIDKVTKKFFRTEKNSWDNSMGLGLAIVKQILKLHNSSLEIKSKEKKGSIFSFII